MNDNELIIRTRTAVNKLLSEKNYIAPVDVFMEINVLSKKDHEAWRFGRISYLEQVIQMHLRKINVLMKELRKIATEKQLKPSYTAYMRWGKGAKQKLTFSKSGVEHLENAYSTHYVIGKTKNMTCHRRTNFV